MGVPLNDSVIVRHSPISGQEHVSKNGLQQNNVLVSELVSSTPARLSNAATISTDTENQRRLRVHRCRFLTYIPHAVSALAFDTASNRLAVARQNGNIEIWSLDQGWTCSLVLFSIDNSSVNAIVWIPSSLGGDERLVSATASGRVVEWDFDTLLPKTQVDSYGGAVWCAHVSFEHTKLALGCHDGSVRIFDISSDALEYYRALSCRGPRVLAVYWAPDFATIVSGDAHGSIQIWDAVSYQNIHRITLDGASVNLDATAVTTTSVCALIVLNDNTIVSGSSTGDLQIWDMKFGSLLQNIKKHTAAISSLVVDSSGTTIFAGGVDSKIVRLTSVANEFIVTYSSRRHTHAVKALALTSSGVLVSGGDDTQLCVYESVARSRSVDNDSCLYPQQMMTWKIAPFLHDNDVICIASLRRVILYRLPHSIQLWLLPVSTDLQSSSKSPRHLHDIVLPVTSHVRAAAISSSGDFVSCATATEIRLYRLRYSGSSSVIIEHVKAKRIDIDWYHIEDALVVTCLTFSTDSSLLCVGTGNGNIYVIHTRKRKQRVVKLDNAFLDGGVASHLSSESSAAYSSRIVRIACTDQSGWLVCANARNTIYVYRCAAGQPSGHFALHGEQPTLADLVTCLAFGSGPMLAVACSSNKVFVYDLIKMQLSPWSRSNSHRLPYRLLSQREKIVRIEFRPEHKSTLIMHSHSYLCKIDLSINLLDQDEQVSTLQSTPHRPVKARRLALTQHRSFQVNDSILPFDDTVSSQNLSVDSNNGLQIVYKFRPLLFAGFVSLDELVVVETPWLNIMRQFAPAHERARYGQ